MKRMFSECSDFFDDLEPGFIPNILYIGFICLPAMLLAVVGAWVLFLGKAVVK